MANKKDYKPVSDAEIVNIIDEQIRKSIGYYGSQLSRERKQVVDYYNGTLPRRTHDGNSSYVSMDVYDAVESLKSRLLETFSAGSKTVKFAPQNAEDVKLAAMCTEYTDYVVNRQNNAQSIMSDVIHDGLVARLGVCKVFWEEKEDLQKQFFEDLTQDQLDIVLGEEGVELGETEEDELGLISGSITVSRDTSQVTIENVAPEEFIVEQAAKNLEDCNFVAHRTHKTLSELRLMGYPEKVLKKMGDHKDVDLELDPEFMARQGNIDSGISWSEDHYQDQVKRVLVYESYVKLDIDASGIAKLYRVLKAGNAILEKEEVSRLPFIIFCPLPIPHTLMGNNYAHKVVPTQNARTVLTRSILDHAVLTNSPRYQIMKGSLPNPKEILDSRVGGLVNVTRPDAISPLPQAPLNPHVFQLIGLLDEDKEEVTGVSKLSSGLNKDAVSKQNSASMVEQLNTMSQERSKIIARNFATQFVKPLYQLVYQLVIENETQEKIVDLSGEYVRVDPSSWADKRDVSIELHLGYQARERESQKFLAMHQLFKSDPQLSKMYTIENQHKLMTQVMDMTGIPNAAEYLTPPEQLPQEQPDPMQELNIELVKKQIEVQERQTQVAEAKLQLQAQNDQTKQAMDQEKAAKLHAIASDQVDLDEARFNHKKLIDAAELKLAEKADDENVRVIASPNG